MAMLSTKEVRMYLRIRNLCGLLGIILPWIALFSAGIVLNKPEGWWWSISATYYQSPALVGVLVPACIVMMSYIGYDWKDNLITTLTGLFGLGIVLFPCKVDPSRFPRSSIPPAPCCSSCAPPSTPSASSPSTAPP